MQLVFFDTETTGVDGKHHRLCQLAYQCFTVIDGSLSKSGVEFSGLYRPPVPIDFEAMAVHHITAEMVADKSLFKESNEYAGIKELFEDPETIAVAHNAKFDVEMLGREGIVIPKVICTMKIVQHIDGEGQLSNYKLQYLRYRFGLDIAADSHDAMGDVIVLRALFDHIYTKLPLSGNPFEYMVQLSDQRSMIAKFKFGKYAGKKFSWVAKNNKSYLVWLLDSESKKESPNEDLVYTLKHYVM